MRSFATVLGLLGVLGGGYFVYNSYLNARGGTATPPQEQIDVVAVQSELLSIAQAERQYLATRGAYATLDQLQQEGLLTGGLERRGYTFTATVDGAAAFTITGTPTAPEKSGWPIMTIDHTMQVTRH